MYIYTYMYKYVLGSLNLSKTLRKTDNITKGGNREGNKKKNYIWNELELFFFLEFWFWFSRFPFFIFFFYILCFFPLNLCVLLAYRAECGAVGGRPSLARGGGLPGDKQQTATLAQNAS